ncbi:hypothetical protein BT69DRAFT_1307623 [Atractiella rhizophila]|nr:hypothetical protein BT69DRAFT_1307623 [Atractiella rhizophila]
MHGEILSKIDVVCSTTWGTSALELHTVDFPLVFIDEAAMCTEPMTLIPLMKGSRQAVLIGDHMQLPAITVSRDARKDNLNMSMFERLERTAHIPTSLLDIQYRMLPSISAFPNHSSYSSQIRDDRSLLKVYPPKSSYLPSPPSQNGQSAVFINHAYPETAEGWSYSNEREADISALILGDLLMKNPELKGSDMGIITPYAAQTTLIWEKLRDPFSLQLLFKGDVPSDRIQSLADVEVNTVDGFQGREKEVIVLSTVRSNKGGHVGFLEDKRRLNVSLTRAKRALFVLGNQLTLKLRQNTEFWLYMRDFGDVQTWRGSRVWEEYLAWMEKRGLLLDWKESN